MRIRPGEFRRRKPLRFPSLLASPRAAARRRADRRRSRRSCSPSARPRATRPSISTGRSSSATARSSGTTSGTRGTYPLASYSLLYYLPAALVGNLPLVFAAAVASTVLFASIALREWGTPRVWPSRVFGVLAAAPLFTGLYATRSASPRCSRRSSCCSCGGLARRRSSPRSPSASARSPSRSSASIVGSYAVCAAADHAPDVWFGVGLAVAAGIELRRARPLPERDGRLPVPLDRLRRRLGRHGARRPPRPARSRRRAARRVLRALGARQRRRSTSCPSPLGDNWTRLSAFVFPVMLLTASLAGFRPRRLVVLALAAALAYNLVPYALLVPSRLDNDTQQASFWRPAIRFLRHTRAAGLPGRGRADGGALGGVLDPEVGLPARPRLVPAARRRRQPGALREAPRRRGVPALAALGRRPLRPPQHDRAARLGRRPAGGARPALAAAPG